MDQLISLCEPGPDIRALDVATGGGHVARRLRAAGCDVTSCDAAEGMSPDVVCPAESLPFPDAMFDVVVCRIAAHHFADVQTAIHEMARVGRRWVVVEDNLFVDEPSEVADLIRDSTHIRNYDELRWRLFFGDADLVIDHVQIFDRSVPMAPWLARTGCAGADAKKVGSLIAPRIADDNLVLPTILIRGRLANC